MADNGLTHFRALPVYDLDPAIRYKQAIKALNNLPGQYSTRGQFSPQSETLDIKIYRDQALRNLDGEPDIDAIANVSRLGNSRFSDLSVLVEAGRNGTRGPGFVKDCKDRAEEVDTLLKEFDKHALQVRERRGELRQLLQTVKDQTAREEIQKKIDALDAVLKVFQQPSNSRDELNEFLRFVKSDRFNETSLVNWLKEHGPAIAATIAAFMAATAICIATFGTAGPVAVVLVGATLTVVFTQSTSEALYQINHSSLGDTGFGSYNERSYLGTYAMDNGGILRIDQALRGALNEPDLASRAKKLLDFYTSERPLFIDQVALPLSAEWGLNVAFGFICMGAGALGQTLRGCVPQAVERVFLSPSGQQFKNNLQRAAVESSKSEAGQTFFKQWLRVARREFNSNVGFAGAQESGTAVLEKTLQGRVDNANEELVFVTAIVLSLGVGAIKNPRALRLGPSGREAFVLPECESVLIKGLKENPTIRVEEVSPGIYHLFDKNAPQGQQPFVIKRANPKTVMVDGKPIEGGERIPEGKKAIVDGREVVRVKDSEAIAPVFRSEGPNKSPELPKPEGQNKKTDPLQDIGKPASRAEEFVEWHNDGIFPNGEYFYVDPVSGVGTKLYVGRETVKLTSRKDGSVRYGERSAGDYVKTEQAYEVLDALRAAKIKPEAVHIVNRYDGYPSGNFEPRLSDITVNVAGGRQLRFIYNHETGHLIEFSLAYETLPPALKAEYAAAYTKGLKEPGGLVDKLKGKRSADQIIAEMNDPANRFVSSDKSVLLYENCPAEINAEHYAMYCENKHRVARGEPELSYAELAKLSNRPEMKNYAELYEVNKKIFARAEAMGPAQPNSRTDALKESTPPDQLPSTGKPQNMPEPKTSPSAKNDSSAVKPTGGNVEAKNLSKPEGLELPIDTTPATGPEAQALQQALVSKLRKSGWPKSTATKYAESLPMGELKQTLRGLESKQPRVVFIGGKPIDPASPLGRDEVTNPVTALEIFAPNKGDVVNIIEGVPSDAVVSRSKSGDTAFYEQALLLKLDQLSVEPRIYTVPRDEFALIVAKASEGHTITLTDPETGLTFNTIKPGHEPIVEARIIEIIKEKGIKPVRGGSTN